MTGLDGFFLWAGFACMLAGLLYFAYLRFTKATPESRGFYDKSILIVLVATCSYLAMALGLGQVRLADGHRVFTPRYIDWVVTTPLLLLDLLFLAKPLNRKNWGWDAVTILTFDAVMIVTGVISGVTLNGARWVWFVVSTLAYIVVAVRVINLIRAASAIPDTRVASKLRVMASYLSVVWVFYPIVFALYFAGVFNGVTEDVLYAILDVTAKVGFGAVLLAGPAVELVERVRNVYDTPTPRERQTRLPGGSPARS